MQSRALGSALALGVLAFSVSALAQGPGLGQESIPPGEDAAIQRIAEMIEKGVRDKAAETGFARRDAHAKHHGCVKGVFEVAADVPAALQQGVMKPGARYVSWVRFSNGSGNLQKDSSADGRGIAIKLTGIPGKKILADERDAQTQDFLMINHPVFFIRSAEDYVGLTELMSKGGIVAALKYFLNPLHPKFHELNIARQVLTKKTSNPLGIQYWSMTPYQWGPDGSGRAVKLSVAPCAGSQAARFKGDASSPDALRQAMSRQLAETEACFDFFVQPQTDAAKMPIEDSTEEWSEKLSPYVRVATLRIPAQKFESAEQMAFCENLSYTPWHALPEHRPLGGINRARKTVYETIQRVRHGLNGAKMQEPTGLETF